MTAPNLPRNGFVFANAVNADYAQFSQEIIDADEGVGGGKDAPPPVIVAVPPPRVDPPLMSLDSVLDPTAISSNYPSSLSFHVAGDTGGIEKRDGQLAVATALVSDYAGQTGSSVPGFLFHVGDVVYFYGQDQYFESQFYDPYRNYPAPIFAIPGNHDACALPPSDGDPAPDGPPVTLQAFQKHFCAAAPTALVAGYDRTAMTQPGVYFALDAPFVKIIGLFSNTSEAAAGGVISGPEIGDAQVTFLTQQLQAAKAQVVAGAHPAIVLAVHHPPFSLSRKNDPSPGMLRVIDTACKAAGIYPDMVISGHAHLYERYTRSIGGSQIPFVVTGNGGYFELAGLKTSFAGTPPQPGDTARDYAGNTVTVEAFNETLFGFARVSISAEDITFATFGVDTDGNVSQIDNFTVDLNAHTVV